MLYLALYKLYISAFVEKNEVIEREMKEAVVEAITEVRKYQMSNKDIIKLNHKNVLLSNSNINFESLIKEFDDSLQNQSRCYKNYITLFEKLLLFIRASREQNWQLHLYSLHLLHILLSSTTHA